MHENACDGTVCVFVLYQCMCTLTHNFAYVGLDDDVMIIKRSVLGLQSSILFLPAILPVRLFFSVSHSCGT